MLHTGSHDQKYLGEQIGLDTFSKDRRENKKLDEEGGESRSRNKWGKVSNYKWFLSILIFQDLSKQKSIISNILDCLVPKNLNQDSTSIGFQ